MKVKKMLAVKTLKKSAGANWQESKYVYAISCIQTFLYRGNECIADLLRCVDGLAQVSSVLSEVMYLYCNDTVELHHAENYQCLQDIGNLGKWNMCDDDRSS